jgi:hypothetical protein
MGGTPMPRFEIVSKNPTVAPRRREVESVDSGPYRDKEPVREGPAGGQLYELTGTASLHRVSYPNGRKFLELAWAVG